MPKGTTKKGKKVVSSGAAAKSTGSGLEHASSCELHGLHFLRWSRLQMLIDISELAGGQQAMTKTCPRFESNVFRLSVGKRLSNVRQMREGSLDL